jgi:hypothetical protein
MPFSRLVGRAGHAPVPASSRFCLILAVLELGCAACLLAASPALPAAPPAGVQATFGFEFAVPGGGPVAGVLRARRGGDGATDRVVEIRGTEPVTMTLPAGASWEISGEIAGYWLRRETIAPDSSSPTISKQLRLWPLGHIAGTVKVAGPAAELPKLVTVTTLAARQQGARDVPRGTLECPVDKAGKWSCELPAARFDLAIAAAGFVPHYRFSQQVPVGKVVAVGILELRRGASVAGWAAVADGRLDGAHCRVRLSPLLAGGSARAETIRQTAREARVDGQGFFQLAGVRPGSYALSVDQPGFAPARVSPLTVTEDHETLLRDPLLLRRPFAIELAVDPPRDWLERPWRIQVFRAGDGSTRLQAPLVHEGPTDAEGVALIAGQEPGNYSIRVGDSLGNWLYAEENLALEGSEKIRHDISIRLVTVKGTLSLGRDPLAGELWFGGRHGKTSVKMESDSKGRFSGVLAREGMWDLEVRAPAAKVADLRRVRIEADRLGRAQIEVVLPNTKAFGRVVFEEDDRPAAGATVSLSASAQSDLQVLADSAGAFEFRGFATGTVLLTAALPAESRFSDQVSVAADADRPAGPVELRLQRKKTLTGKVGSRQGPVVGASVDVITLRPTPILVGPAVTDLQGEFTASVPSRTEAALAIVSAPGEGLQAFEVAADAGAEAYLEVAQDAGTVGVELGQSAEEFERQGVAVQVFQDGHSLPLPLLYRWARLNGKPSLIAGKPPVLTIPALAPGLYQVCLVPLSSGMGWLSPPVGEPRARCATGTLSSGGNLTLRLGS